MPGTHHDQRVAAPDVLSPFKKLIVSAIAIGIAMCLCASAQATVYDWTYTDIGATGSGTLTTGGQNNGGAIITGITGVFNGGAISGLGGGFFADDRLFPSSPLLDYNGLAFHATILGVPTTVELFYESQRQSLFGQAGYGFTAYPQSFEFCNNPDSCSSAGMRIEGIDITARLNSGLSGQFEVVSATPLPGALPLLGTVLGAAYVVSRRRRHRALGSGVVGSVRLSNQVRRPLRLSGV